MSIPMPSAVFKFPGQVVNKVTFGASSNQLIFTCRRDSRRKVFDPETGQSGTINRYVRRRIKDIPLFGCYSIIEIELAEVRLGNGVRRIEEVCFVEKGCYYTKRFCKLISGLCRHMTIQSVAKHFDLRWETVKNMDKLYLQATLPALSPGQLNNLKYIGVDEVARAKGHDYDGLNRCYRIANWLKSLNLGANSLRFSLLVLFFIRKNCLISSNTKDN